MFVTLSMGMHLVSDASRENIESFVTPNIFYFVSALVLACVMLVPTFTPSLLALVLGLGGLLGLARTSQFVRRLIQVAKRAQDFNLGDWLAQVILPLLNYLLILFAALCFSADQWTLAFMSVWLAMILLLVSAIANTWSLVMWIIEQRKS
jgi:hypothetical protein